jgi:hypothetical protein
MSGRTLFKREENHYISERHIKFLTYCNVEVEVHQEISLELLSLSIISPYLHWCSFSCHWVVCVVTANEERFIEDCFGYSLVRNTKPGKHSCVLCLLVFHLYRCIRSLKQSTISTTQYNSQMFCQHCEKTFFSIILK